jgi:osmotically-inducible protein OsmY
MKTSKLFVLSAVVAASAAFFSACSKDASKTTDQVAAAAPTGDAAINAQVLAALHANPTTAALKISVTTQDGVVHVTGDAPGGGEKDKVSEVSKAVAGVKSVTNDITVHDH